MNDSTARDALIRTIGDARCETEPKGDRKDRWMPTYDVSDRDLEDGHMTTRDALDAETAAERWAEEYCAYHAEYDVEECFVRQAGRPWQRYSITIESRPTFHATEATT